MSSKIKDNLVLVKDGLIKYLSKIPVYIYGIIFLAIIVWSYFNQKKNCNDFVDSLDEGFVDFIDKFQDYKEKRKEESVCIKPFMVTSDKSKMYEALGALNDKMEEIEFTMTDNNKKYSEMYEWYKIKIKKDKEAGEKAAKKAQAEIQKSLNDTLTKGVNDYTEKNKGKFEDDAAKNAPPEGQTVKDLMKDAKKQGDTDDLSEVNAAMKDIDAPKGFF